MSIGGDGLTRESLPQWYEQAVAALEFPLGWKEPCADPATWRARARDAFRSLLLEDASPLPPDAVVEASERRDGYRVDEVSLTLGRFRRSRAFLAVPDGPGPFPAVLALHDHGAFFELGREKLVRPFAASPRQAAADDWTATNYGGRFVGDDLAQAGWVVLVTDALGWGDRACGGYETQQAVASNLFNLGSSWAGVVAVEDSAAAAFLASLPFVNASRVVSLGHSMGGFRSYQVAALSEHIRAAVASCCFGTLAGMMVPGGNRVRGQSAFSMTHPGLTRVLDFPDVAGLIAPRPLLFLHGTDDPLFPEASVREACAKTARVYRAWDREGVFAAEFHRGGHAFERSDQAKAVAWLDRVCPPV